MKAKNRTSLDWHPADVKAALEKLGWSLRRLSQGHDYHPTVLAAALTRPFPRGEAIIAATLGKSAQEIWPSRYTREGLPNRGKLPNATTRALLDGGGHAG